MSVTTPHSDRAPVPAGHLAYDVAGSGRPVVLLHAGGVDKRMWENEFRLLASDHLVVRYDARGHGDSSTPAGDWEWHEDLLALLDHLGIARATLVGCSLGASTAVDTAIAAPDRVEAALLVGPGLLPMTFTSEWALARQAEQQAAVAAWDASAYVEASLRWWVDGPHRSPEQTDAGVRALCRDMITQTVVRHAAQSGTYHGVGARDRLGEVRCPLETVVGSLENEDNAAVVDLLLSHGPGTRHHVVDGAVHLVNLDRPAAFARLLLEFLGRTQRP